MYECTRILLITRINHLFINYLYILILIFKPLNYVTYSVDASPTDAAPLVLSIQRIVSHRASVNCCGVTATCGGRGGGGGEGKKGGGRKEGGDMCVSAE